MRYIRALLLPVVVVALCTATTNVAHAAGSCSIVVPAKVSVKASTTPITAHVGSNCIANHMSDASWQVSPVALFYFFDSTVHTDTEFFYSFIDSVGPQRAYGQGAYDSNFDGMTQNNPAFTIKYGTWVYISSTRKGSAVYINALVHQWSSNDLISPSGRRVYLQRYIHGSWQSMLSRLTIAGKFTVGFIQPTVYQYRLLATESGTAWGGTSASTFR